MFEGSIMKLWREWKRFRGWMWFETYDGGDWRRDPAPARDVVEIVDLPQATTDPAPGFAG